MSSKVHKKEAIPCIRKQSLRITNNDSNEAPDQDTVR